MLELVSQASSGPRGPGNAPAVLSRPVGRHRPAVRRRDATHAHHSIGFEIAGAAGGAWTEADGAAGRAAASTSSCARCRASAAAPPRWPATSSASGCSGCPGSGPSTATSPSAMCPRRQRAEGCRSGTRDRMNREKRTGRQGVIVTPSCKVSGSWRWRSTRSCRPPPPCCRTGAPRSSRSSTSSGATPCGAWPRRGWPSSPTTCTCCSSTPTGARRAWASTSPPPTGLDILYQLAATCDVFLTNKLPSVRTKLHIDLDEIRAHNPNIIYVRGTGQGERGPDADKGSYDALAFWARSGVAMGGQAARVRPGPGPAGPRLRRLHRRHDHRRRDHGRPVPPRAHRRGHRGRRVAAGHRPVGHGPGRGAVAGARPPVAPAGRRQHGGPTRCRGPTTPRTVASCAFTCLQAAKYWPLLCQTLGRPELAADPRFADHASL